MGGGIFGTTAAVELARNGADVHLYEAKDRLLPAASGINQYRLHRGYHYPRSDETARACQRSVAPFRERYGDAVVGSSVNHYCIAGRDTLTTPTEFLDFIERHGFPYEREIPAIIHEEAVDLGIRAEEDLVDPRALRELCRGHLERAGVEVHLGRRFTPDEQPRYDHTVLATYARLNELTEPLAGVRRDYKFQVCEKPIARMPDPYEGQSVVVMDGPFMCVDPYGTTGLSVLGNVVEAIHAENVGPKPEIPSEIEPLLDRGVIEDPPVTNFDRFVETATEFFDGFEEAEHVGSMYTVRTVLPNREDTDARPTIVDRLSEDVTLVFSGKIGTCVEAARALCGNLLGRGEKVVEASAGGVRGR